MHVDTEFQNMLIIDEIEHEYGLKRSTLYFYVRKGLLTPYKKIGDRKSYFKKSEVENLLQFQPRKTSVDKQTS
ncbi:unnamed protein product [marine sediment metagenome]|uniref:HTH merR-type domain-containing protein n=1 Tax=marine sediment metagenome TaxID=412755 RepID=X1QSP4_9ZZZZ